MTWSTSGKPTASIPEAYRDREDVSDVGSCLKPFATLRNPTKASIDLPLSLRGTEQLEDMARVFELSMANIEPFDEEDVDAWIYGLELSIDYIGPGTEERGRIKGQH